MLNEVIQKKISELPKNIRKAIEKFDWATEIMHIARDNKMQIDDIDTFKKETLLVIVGLTSAVDFEKNLVKQLGIPHSFAEKLVADANEYIFYPLQRLAFTKKNEKLDSRQGFSSQMRESNDKEDWNNEELEQEVVSHEDVTNLMNDHGIELIEEERENPKNELQDLADSLFGENTPERKNKIPAKNYSHKNEDIVAANKTGKKDKVEKNTNDKIPDRPTYRANETQNNNSASYRETIREEDLEGISGHRIDTSILKKREDLQRIKPEESGLLEKEHTLDLNNLNRINISKEERIDVSPSKEKQISERGDFLKHIGAS